MHNQSMYFADRKQELRRLRRATESPEGGLIVLWGRRRVGKTRLLLEWVHSTDGLYWVADSSAASVQRRYFAETIDVRLPGFAQVDYPDWRSFFSRLARDAQQAGWRGPLVLDELPYLLGSSPELSSVLQHFVDHDGQQAKFVLALAGSSQRMMQGLALDADAPLYGRARELMKLLPVPAGYLGGALGLDDARRSVQAYALWGGIPRYWELAASFADLHDAVDTLVLDPLGPLHEEPTRLLLEETPPAVALRPILDAIGGGAHRVSEIAGRIGAPATSLARPLTRLQELDLVVREVPFGQAERSTKRALYKLADPFLRLWFSLVAPKRSILMQVARKARLQMFDKVFPYLCSAAWEDLCRQAVPRLGARLGGIDFGPARRFWAGDSPEWDVVAEAADGSALLLGEAKWTESDPSPAQVEQVVRGLLAKGIPPARHTQGAQVHHVVFVPRVPRRVPKPAGVHIVGAADVLAVLR